MMQQTNIHHCTFTAQSRLNQNRNIHSKECDTYTRNKIQSYPNEIHMLTKSWWMACLPFHLVLNCCCTCMLVLIMSPECLQWQPPFGCLMNGWNRFQWGFVTAVKITDRQTEVSSCSSSASDTTHPSDTTRLFPVLLDGFLLNHWQFSPGPTASHAPPPTHSRPVGEPGQ